MGNPLFDDLDEMFKGVTAQEPTKSEENITAQPVDVSMPIFSQPSTPNQGAVAKAQAKLKMMEQELNLLFVERDEVIKNLMMALVTGQSMLLLGMPGTAKSALTSEVCSRIVNGTYFQWMLNKTSDPSEILGPYSIKEMENDRFMRITTGKLPEAHIAFIDECYKANAPVLNTLLPIMNEKIFYNDGRPNPIPLITMVGASNEGPEDESLMAFHDRFLFRINVKYVKDAANKKRMYSNYLDNRAGLLGLTSKTTITIDELKMLNEATKTVTMSKDTINKYIKFINDLAKESIHISDRRQNECIKVMQGSAVVNGRTSVGLDDFKSLLYVLWEKEEHIPIIESIILKMVNPFDDRFVEFKNSFEQIKAGVLSAKNDSEKSQRALEAKATVEKLTTKLNKLISEATSNGKDVDDYVQFRATITAFTTKAVQEALGGSILGNDGKLF